MFLGLNLVLLCVNYLLLVSLSWNCRGLCKPTNIEIFNRCNFHLFFSFFSKKKELMAGILTVCKIKAICVGFGGMNRAIKTKIMQECDHQKRFLMSKEDIFAYIRYELHKNNHFVLVVQPQDFVKSCTQNLL